MIPDALDNHIVSNGIVVFDVSLIGVIGQFNIKRLPNTAAKTEIIIIKSIKSKFFNATCCGYARSVVLLAVQKDVHIVQDFQFGQGLLQSFGLLLLFQFLLV